uniref:Uncharacterized protein n=1 Tax=Rhizophora mucronata TaxID=61149 RepID=A0A2P2N1P6_RHIMU
MWCMFKVWVPSNGLINYEARMQILDHSIFSFTSTYLKLLKKGRIKLYCFLAAA